MKPYEGFSNARLLQTDDDVANEDEIILFLRVPATADVDINLRQ